MRANSGEGVAFGGPVDDCAEQRAALRPVLIGGVVRSATSWTFRLLADHPEFAAPGGQSGPKEVRLFERLFGPGLPSGLSREMYGELMYVCGKYFADRLGNGRRWVDGSPDNHLAFPAILEWFANARCIMRIRHPQEVFWSERQTPWNRDKPEQVVMQRNAASWRRAAQTWLRLSENPDPRILLLRHEDLVDDPEREIRQIFEFVDAPLTDEMRHHGMTMLAHSTASAAADKSEMTHSRSPEEIKAYFTRRRQEIAADANFCTRVVKHIGEQMEQLGYKCLHEVGSETSAAAPAEP